MVVNMNFTDLVSFSDWPYIVIVVSLVTFLWEKLIRWVLLGYNFILHLSHQVRIWIHVAEINVENDKVVSTLSNIVHINVEIDYVDSKLFNVVNSNVDVCNVVSTLIWYCPTSQYHINLATTFSETFAGTR